jgi:phosphoglycerol transferase MdoB-like AlkP superfamily enzyme
MEKIKTWFQNLIPKIKEWFRKKLVTLKRRPFFIPLLMIIISCLVLNLSLTSYSNTVAQINLPGMGLTLFVLTLCSYLSVISFATAFPNRKKPKIASVVLVCLMILISIGCQLLLQYFIYYGTVLVENMYILKAKNNSLTHIICNGVSLLLVVTMPLYSKLLKKINTRVKTDDEIFIEGLELAEEENY